MTLLRELKTNYLLAHPDHASRYLESLTQSQLKEELNGISAKSLLTALDRVTTSQASAIFGLLSAHQQREVIATASVRLTVLLISRLSSAKREELLNSLNEGTRNELTHLLEFPENSAGRLMDPPIDVRSEMNIEQVTTRMDDAGVERARSIYVVDDNNRLLGRVDMQDLALAKPGWIVADFIKKTDAALSPMSPKSEIVDYLNRTRLDSVPIVDVEQRLLGVVRHHRIFEAIESVANADLQKMVGVSADERALSTALFAVSRRLPWLHINLLTAFLAAAVVGLFSDLIAQFTALAVLLPVVAGQSGNAGSQALAVTIRGIALKEINIRDWRRVLKKECIVGLINGGALAVSCGLGVYLWSKSIGLSIVIAIAMVLSLLSAGIAGALVPIILTKIGKDPATASSIILTTVTDVTGFFAFLGTATLMTSLI
jgi:magnesium transporter